MADPRLKFLELCVKDVMHKDVVTVDQYLSMSEVADILQQHEISGAPVVDEVGKCVGMISAADFVRFERQAKQAEAEISHGMTFDLIEDDSPGGSHVVENPFDKVYRHMSAGVQTIDASAKLHAAAKIMCLEHIHRLVVLDNTERPIGIMTALDLVATMWNLELFAELNE